jgi:hypothetical protein
LATFSLRAALPISRKCDNPVEYPFKSFVGDVKFDRQKTGDREFDINSDGVAHYGLYPDWIEDLRMIAGDQIIKEMGRGAEAYLEMWERTDGIRPAHRCPAGGGDFTDRSLKRMRLGMTPVQLLRKVRRQPLSRGKVWKYCVREPRTYERPRNSVVFGRGGRVVMIATTARSHRAALVGVRSRAQQLQGARRLAKDVLTWNAGHGNRYVFGVRKGRVRYVALASRRMASRRGILRNLRLAGLR